MVTVPSELKARVEERVRECLDLANQEYGLSLGMPPMLYILRGSTAGKAMSNYELRFHPTLLVAETDRYLKRTVPHEVAHLVVGAREHLGHYRGFKVKSHGRQWKEVMRLYDAEETRCHSYDISGFRLRKTRYEYKCGNPVCGKVISVGGKVHNQLQKDPNSRWHKSCKHHPLIPVGKIPASKGGKPITSTTKLKAPEAETKLAQCYALYKSWHHRYGRQDMIAVFTQEVYPLTNACASTYYYQCQKLWEAGI